jgi:capsid protein
LATDPTATFGVQTDASDVETVRGYYVDGQFVDAAMIQHRKANVDANVKRGLPLFYPVRKNLRRAEKLLRNMSVVSEIQSAIAIIRKHAAATSVGLEQFVANQADFSSTGQTTGRTSHFRRFAPGTILDALSGTEYEFPAAGIDAGRYVTVLQAELRAIASRLVMPEFMLSSDASNANYSSTMVAEGPAVKMFERLQHEMIEDDLDVMRQVVLYAVEAGRLPAEAISTVDIRGIPPSLAVRDRLKEAQADQILVRNGAMSVQTMSMRNGLDPEHEQQLIVQKEVASIA